MAVVIKQVMPDGVPIEVLDAVTEEMGVDADPPKGMIVHVHYKHGGEVHVLDVWESAEDHESFVEGRLMPAMGKVAERQGMTPPAPNPPTVIEVHRVVKGG